MEIDAVRSVSELVDQIAVGHEPEYVFFWGHQGSGSGDLGPSCLSQWWPAHFVHDGHDFPTAEHFMMWSKARMFADQQVADSILATESPRQAKALGRQVRGFRDDVWRERRWDVVVGASSAKFASDPSWTRYLLSTGTTVLVEASPVDRVWGIGLAADHVDAARPDAWPGQNLLGFALMEARARLRES